MHRLPSRIDKGGGETWQEFDEPNLTQRIASMSSQTMQEKESLKQSLKSLSATAHADSLTNTKHKPLPL